MLWVLKWKSLAVLLLDFHSDTWSVRLSYGDVFRFAGRSCYCCWNIAIISMKHSECGYCLLMKSELSALTDFRAGSFKAVWFWQEKWILNNFFYNLFSIKPLKHCILAVEFCYFLHWSYWAKHTYTLFTLLNLVPQCFLGWLRSSKPAFMWFQLPLNRMICFRVPSERTFKSDLDLCKYS